MSSPRVRPTFEYPLAGTPNKFYASLTSALGNLDATCTGHLFADGAILRTRSDERHIWSPALHIRVERSGAGTNIVHGQFTPSSPVWTGFLAIYIGLACVAIAGSCYGCAQVTIDDTPWALLALPIAGVLAGLTYGAAFLGQGLGANDMFELRSFVQGVADSAQTTQSAPSESRS